jgi:TPR repeat protein
LLIIGVTMRLEDIQLRTAAKRGDPQACLAVAAQLFTGREGARQNHTLGLAYLQELIARQSPAALRLIGEAVPLDVLVGQQLQAALLHAAQQACAAAMLKWGVWLAMTEATRDEGIAWVLRVHPLAASGDGSLIAPEYLARHLAVADPKMTGLRDAATLCASDALDRQDVMGAEYCIRFAAEGTEMQPALAEVIARTAVLAAQSGADLEMPVALIERGLSICAERGSAEAQYVLGCALAGKPYGRLPAHRLVRTGNTERAAALLLRAADAGKHRAWLDLFDVSPIARSGDASRGMARFFLEKAADAGVVDAQTKLGALLLKEAATLDAAERAMQWLHAAARTGDAKSGEILATLVLPMPELPPEHESALLARVAGHDRELAVRLSLARRLHLTRHEALSFNARRDLREWGMFVRGSCKENPAGRAAPAVSDAMREELARAALFFQTASALESSLVLQRSRTQRRIFKLLGIADSQFFAQGIGRSRSHHGYGRHWAAKASGVLLNLQAMHMKFRTGQEVQPVYTD